MQEMCWNSGISLLKIAEMDFMEYCIHPVFNWRLKSQPRKNHKYIFNSKIINLEFRPKKKAINPVCIKSNNNNKNPQ